MSGDSSETPPETPDRAGATGEFFSVGTPLHAVRAGYVRRRSDDLLYEAAIAGRYAHIIAPDRSGKSSLIAATTARLEGHGVAVAVLDLEQMGTREGAQDAGRWYYSVAYRLLRQLRIRYDLQTWWQDKSVLGNRQRLLEFYSEVILQNVQKPIVIFVDEIQCTADLPFADQLLASIRSAHNARVTDPDFGRLTFVLLGECDPLSLVNEAEMSPFNLTQSIPLADFTREDLNLFATELNLMPDDATAALDRIFYWTSGQPYLSQKLARAVSRERVSGDIVGHVDRIVGNQLAGRAALHNEPHMSHIHREIVSHNKNCEALLNLYGRIRKGIDVPADFGSGQQRRLMAVGLLVVDDAGELNVRNRIYEAVFTARWANENLPTHWKTPLLVAAVIGVVLLVPLWYTQWMPNAYVDVLTSPQVELPVAETAWRNLRSFPGHARTADDLYQNFLSGRASASTDAAELETIADMALALPDSGPMPQTLLADFWDRQVAAAVREERRDEALLASLESLALSTPRRRNRSAMLVGDDYPLMLASLPDGEPSDYVFNPDSLLLTALNGSQVSQWSLGPQGLVRSDDWTVTALEVAPLVRRVIVDQQGNVERIGLTLSISHPRIADLRIKVIAPSGRAVEVQIDREHASSADDLRIPREQLQPLLGESLNGTWSVSFRDESIGVAGHLAGWNLRLNSQGLVEDFQRGMSIPDPLERETEQIWIDKDGRYAVARATQSDSVRIWDLAFAKPVSAIAVSEGERLIGIDEGARTLATATLETVHLWDTATGRLLATLPIGAASQTATLTSDGRSVFVQYRSDTETRLELWSLGAAEKVGELLIAGAPALVALDASGGRIAVADYDRAVRVWDFANGELVAQLDLPLQPSSIEIDATGRSLGAAFGTGGVAVWNVNSPQAPLLEEFGEGRWQLRFSRSGARVVAGHSRSGYRVYQSEDGRPIGPAVGVAGAGALPTMLAFGKDEGVVVTSGGDGVVRFWQLPVVAAPAVEPDTETGLESWSRPGEAVVSALPDGSALVFGDREGHVHIVASDVAANGANFESDDVHFLGHTDVVRKIAVSRDSARIASVASDNSIRVWTTSAGIPDPFIANFAGAEIEHLVFSKDGSRLGMLAGQQAAVMDAVTGDMLAEFDLGVRHTAIEFGYDGVLYVGGDNGALSIIKPDATGSWSLQRLWTGEAAIREMAASPRGRSLVLVDGDHRAQQFDLQEGRPGTLWLNLPTAVEEIVFSPNGSRVLFRSARWVHRTGSAANGLIWLNAMFLPDVASDSGIVFGEPQDPSMSAGGAFDLVVRRGGRVQIERLRFGDTDGPGLFGNKNELIESWRAKLAR